MEFRFNFRKGHLVTILVLLLITSLGIAQTPPNPGHGANQVTLSSGQNLDTWSGITSQRIDAIENNLNNYHLWGSPWSFSSPISSGAPYYSANLLSSLSVGATTHNIPASIPSTAKEVLVYAYIARGSQGGTSGPPIDITIYTYDGNYYSNRLTVINNNNNGAYVVNSDNFWLPITSSRQVNVYLPTSLDGNVQSNLQIIGYR